MRQSNSWSLGWDSLETLRWRTCRCFVGNITRKGGRERSGTGQRGELNWVEGGAKLDRGGAELGCNCKRVVADPTGSPGARRTLQSCPGRWGAGSLYPDVTIFFFFLRWCYFFISFIYLFVYLFIHLFLAAPCRPVGSQFPDQGLNPCPLQ